MPHPRLPHPLPALAALLLACAGCTDRRASHPTATLTAPAPAPAPTPPPAPAPAPPPVLASVSPTGGPAAGGTSVTLAGSGFTAGATVAFGTGLAASVGVSSATQLACTTPAGSGAVTVIVTNPDGQSGALAQGFTYAAPPAPPPLPPPPPPPQPPPSPPPPPPSIWLTRVSPNFDLYTGGTMVTLTGIGFQPGASVTFGPNGAAAVFVSSTTLTCPAPPGTPGTVSVTVTNPGGGSATGPAFAYRLPLVRGVSPFTGHPAGGTLVSVTGWGFLPGATAWFGQSPAPGVVVQSSTLLTCTTPPGTGTVAVTVANPGAMWASGSPFFTYMIPTTIASISPNTGPIVGGTTVTLTGSGFQPGATVQFGYVAASAVTVVSFTRIDCVTPPGNGNVDVWVWNPGGSYGRVPQGFAYDPPPWPNSISPAAGPVAGGQAVTILGANFRPGATVDFGGVAASNVQVVSGLTLTCTTPAHAVGGVLVHVTNPDTQVRAILSGYAFRATPTIVAVSPGIGDVAGGTPLTIAGSGFVPGTTVAFDTVTAPTVVVVSSTTLWVEAPPAAAHPGPVAVTVTTAPGVSASLARGFRYTTSGTVPTISGIAPASGPFPGGTTVTVTGTGFQAGATVTIGGAPAPIVGTPSGTQLVVTTPPEPPPGALVAYPVAVTNPQGATGTLAGPGFAYLPVVAESVADPVGVVDLAIGGSGVLHVVWERVTGSIGAAILTARSTDGGLTWSSPVTLASTGRDLRRPRIAARGADVVAVWNVLSSSTWTWSAHLSVSTDAGQTWSAPTTLPGGGADPDVAITSGGSLLVAVRATVAGSGMHVVVVSGAPGGTLGSPLAVIVRPSGPPSLGPDPAGGQVLVATGYRTGADGLVATSTDGGTTFGTARTLPSALAGYGRCPVVGVGGGTVAMGWVGSGLGRGQWDLETLQAAGSLDGGATFGPPTELRPQYRYLGTGPDYGVDVAVDANGTCVVAWDAWGPRAPTGFSQYEAFTRRSTDGAQTFEPARAISAGRGGVRPRVAAGPAGVFRHAWVARTAATGTLDLYVR